MNHTTELNHTIHDIHKMSHLDNPGNKQTQDTNLSENYNSLHSESIRNNVFTKMVYNGTINNTITIFCLVFWIALSIKFYRTLIIKTTSNIFSVKSRKNYIPFMFIIIAYPTIYFLVQLYHNNSKNNSRLTNISPAYPVCTKSFNDLTSKEKKIGVVGKIDYKCQHNINLFNKKKGELITRRTFYIIHAIFTLILFLFTQRAGKFKNDIITSHSLFITLLIQQALFISLIILSVPTFVEHFYFTTYVTLLFMNMLQMLGAITVMLVSFILFRLIYLFV